MSHPQVNRPSVIGDVMGSTYKGPLEVGTVDFNICSESYTGIDTGELNLKSALKRFSFVFPYNFVYSIFVLHGVLRPKMHIKRSR